MRRATYTPGVALEMQANPPPPVTSRGSHGSEDDILNRSKHADTGTDFHHVDGTAPPHHGFVLEKYPDMGQDEYVFD